MMADRVRREAHVLAALSHCGNVPSPELIASDPTGTDTGGEPALLMTRLAGRVDLTPVDADAWLTQMAAVLPRIHAAPVSAPPFEHWFDLSALVVPAWSSCPNAWSTAIALVREGLPSSNSVFLHRDFQHFNMLWLRGRLSGVVDWVEASTGSPDVDVAHCRLNLAVLFSADRAEQFRLRYEAEAGRSTDPRYDLASLVGYGQHWHQFIPLQAGRRLSVDTAGMDARIDDLLSRVLARC
jgi:aminoglycoside phosphotransferase (APT) family kinase protein